MGTEGAAIGQSIAVSYANKDEGMINEALTELCSKLRLTGWDHPTITWYDVDFRPDLPQFTLAGKGGLQRTLNVNNQLRGRLSPGEWMTLLAPPLVYVTRFRRRVVVAAQGMLLSVVGAIALFLWLFIAGFLPRVPVKTSPAAIPAESLLGTGILSLFLIVILGPYTRKLVIRSDQLASDELGIGPDLLKLLTNIRSFAKVRPRRKIASPWPPIDKRIQALSERFQFTAQGPPI